MEERTVVVCGVFKGAFLSHANADKEQFVDELNSSLEKLGVRIFYEKNLLNGEISGKTAF